jgi:transcription-repair coupling factor (superfamily II helicase)
MTDDARFRIEALERFTELGSGFHVASLDMELRGAGDLLGVEQSGNVAAVGLDLFLHMLEDAVAELRGEPIRHEVDPEITLDLETFIPEIYIEDVGLRLSFYKRLASADDEQAVHDIALELEDRFGPPPVVVKDLVRAMSQRPALRDLCIPGCEASTTRVTLHLREDTPLDPAKVMALVKQPRSPYKLSPDMKLTRRFDATRETESADAIDRIESVLRELATLRLRLP